MWIVGPIQRGCVTFLNIFFFLWLRDFLNKNSKFKKSFIEKITQPLKIKMYTDRPLELFVDPNVKPVAIHKAAIIPI